MPAPEADLSGDRAQAQSLIRAALTALDDAGVAYCLRNGELTALTPGEDVDLLVSAEQVPQVAAPLTATGWRRLQAPGHDGHEFWVCLASDGWVKLDVVSSRRYGTRVEPVTDVVARRRQVDGLWVASEADEERHRAERAAGHREVPTTREKLRRALPLAGRRRGAVVAVLGPDGAGKGTTIDTARAALPVANSVVYLGDRRASARDAARAKTTTEPPTEPAAPSNPPAAQTGAAQSAKEVAFLVRKWARLQPSVAKAYWRAWGGHVVLCDRHPLDAVAVAPVRTPLGRTVERVLAERLTPRPDALVVLDAPGTVLYERKGEHSPEVLERWRQGYRALPGADVIDTTAGLASSSAAVSDVLWNTLARRRGWR